jgi:hypothetical protein
LLQKESPVVHFALLGSREFVEGCPVPPKMAEVEGHQSEAWIPKLESKRNIES